MPQLNPAPWLTIMVTSWLILLTLFTPKTTSTVTQNTPLTNQKNSHKTAPWSWPWA